MNEQLDTTPSKISFEHWGDKVTIKKSHSDINIEEFWEMCKSLARAAGYDEYNIKEYFNNSH